MKKTMILTLAITVGLMSCQNDKKESKETKTVKVEQTDDTEKVEKVFRQFKSLLFISLEKYTSISVQKYTIFRYHVNNLFWF